MLLIITLNFVWVLVAIPGLLFGGYLTGFIVCKREEKISSTRGKQLIKEIKDCEIEIQLLQDELAALERPETIVRSMW